MNMKNMTASELEALIKQKEEIDNKQALNALKQKQRDEMKDLRSELAKKKRQERAELVKNVGEAFMKVFNNKNMTLDDYTKWIDNFVNCWNEAHPKKDNK